MTENSDARGRPWLADNEVTPELAKQLIDEQFPDLAPASLVHLGTGWDNVAFVVNDEAVFRFPRREIAVELLEAEHRLLPRIVDRVPLGVPDLQWVGAPTDPFPRPFSGYPLLVGQTACVADVTGEDRVACAAPLAEFLRALHSIKAEEAKQWGIANDTIRRLDRAHRLPQVEERLDQIEREGWFDDVGSVRRALASTDVDYEPTGTTVVHGDLYVRHVVVDDRGRPTAVIDWGDSHCGDPAIDLSIAWGFLPPDARAEFRRSYGPIDAGRWATARLKAIHSGAMILVYGHDIGDEALVREGQRALNHSTVD